MCLWWAKIFDLIFTGHHVLGYGPSTRGHTHCRVPATDMQFTFPMRHGKPLR